jgi:7-cyano-7-deazaguanine synthase
VTSHPKAVVLLSGGLDSATCLAIARHQGFEPYALSFRYGQRHSLELEAAARVAGAFGAVEHVIVDFDLRQFGGSALTADIDVPKGRDPEHLGSDIPITYVPARNTIFLSFALAWAEVVGAQDIFIGVNALDYSGYPDCRPEYIRAYETMANLATKAGVEGTQRLTIHTPLIQLTKAQIIQRGIELGVDYSLTFSCYDPAPDGAPCGECDSCLLRAKGFAEAGVVDPVLATASVGETSPLYDHLADRIVCNVSHNFSNRPMLFLPDRRTHPGIPRGIVDVVAEGVVYKASFVEIAVNVMRPDGGGPNVLPDTLRSWFGDDAGQAGRGDRVVFERDGSRYRMTPVEKV